MPLPNPNELFARLSRKAKFGLALIYLAGVGWAADLFFLPFMRVPHKVLTIAVILVLAEVCFVIGIALLGKAYYKDLKAKLLALLRQPK